MAGYGMQGHVMLNLQNSYNTAQVTSLQSIPILDESIVETIEWIDEQNMYARFAAGQAFEGKHLIRGTINAEASPQAMGWFVAAYMQRDTPGSEHVHTFTPKQTDFDALVAGTPATLQIYRDVGSAMQYADMVCETLDINITQGEIMNVAAGFLGGVSTRVAAASPTFPTDKPFNWAQSSISIDGAAVTDLMDASLTMTKNLEAVYTLQDSKVPKKIKRSDFERIELSGTMLFQSHSYMQAFEGAAGHTFTANFVGVDSPDNITIDIPQLKFLTYEPTINGKGLVEAPFTALAEYDTDSATAIQIDITNVRTISYF